MEPDFTNAQRPASLRESTDALPVTPPRPWYSFHSPNCGTLFRGCDPYDCPKYIWETSGRWVGPRESAPPDVRRAEGKYECEECDGEFRALTGYREPIACPFCCAAALVWVLPSTE